MEQVQQRHGIRAFLRAPSGTLRELLVVEALAANGVRAFYAYGPAGDPAPHVLDLVVEAPDHVDITAVRVLVRVHPDPDDGVLRFQAPTPLQHGNN